MKLNRKAAGGFQLKSARTACGLLSFFLSFFSSSSSSLLITRNWEIPLGQSADATRLRERIIWLPLVHGRPCVKRRAGGVFTQGFRQGPLPREGGWGVVDVDTIGGFIWSSRRPDSGTIKPKRRTSQMIRKELA